MSVPTQSTFVSFDSSVFNSLGKGVQSAWKLQSKGMLQIFGLVVSDKFMPDCKFRDDKICEQIVTKCITQNETVQMPGMTQDEFVKVTTERFWNEVIHKWPMEDTFSIKFICMMKRVI